MVELTDDAGNLVTNGDVAVNFSVTGAGEMAAIGSANPSDMRSFKSPVCSTFRGRCLVILRPVGNAGEITLSADANAIAKSVTKVDAK